MNEGMKRNRQRLILTAALMATGYGSRAGATTYSYNAAVDTTWTTAGNWISSDPTGHPSPPPATPGTDTTDIVIGGDLHGQSSLSQDRDDDTVSSITINPFSNTGSNGTLSVTASDPLTQPPVTHILRLGAGGITDTSTATVAFQGNAGSVTLTSFRKLVVTSDQTWNINKGGANILSMRRVIEGNFKITKIGPSTLEFMGDNSNWTGGLDVQEGALRLSGIQVAGPFINNNPAGLGTLTVNTPNNIQFSSSGNGAGVGTNTNPQIFNQWIDLGNTTGSLQLSGSRAYEFNGTVNFLTDKRISNSANTGLTIGGVISGTGGLIKAGSNGIVTITGSATYTGQTGVEQGTLSISGFEKLGPGSQQIYLGSGGTQTGCLKLTASSSTNRPMQVKLGSGTLDFPDSVTVSINNTITGAGMLTKLNSGTLNANAIRIGTLAFGGGVVRIAPDGTAAGTSKLAAMNISGQFDLTNNSLVIDYDPALNPNTFQNTMSAVIGGYHNGDWKGNALASSSAAAKVGSAHPTALGYGDASVLGLTSFNGQTFDNTSVVVSYTLAGDANLDGVVNSLDFNALASSYGAATPVWTQGDFDYNGTVNTADFNLLAKNFNLATAAVGSPALGALVPEPMTVLLVPAIALAASQRRRGKLVCAK